MTRVSELELVEELLWKAAAGVLLSFTEDNELIGDTAGKIVAAALADPTLDEDGLVDMGIVMMTVTSTAVLVGKRIQARS